ncbi:peptidoglycan DD-metalloendopeptidase family protein [soil metagenome]
MTAVSAASAAALRRRGRILAIVLATTVLVTGTIVGGDVAHAADYPSWSDVQNARKNEAAKKAEIQRIQNLLAGLESQVVATQAEAESKGQAFFEADLAYNEAAFKAGELQKQADEAQATATASKQQAGQLAARLARAGGSGDLSTTIFFSGSDADALLSQLGMASLVKEQSAGLYQKATQDQNTAQALTDQANVAKEALKVLKDAAEKAMAEAQAAADAAANALAEQQANKARLDAQLQTLITDRQHTEAEYLVGVQVQFGAGSGLGAGEISASGWAKPSGGNVVSGYGPRVAPCSGCSSFHQGADLNAGCNASIYAAHAGTVVYAGWNGGYGNYIKISNGDGTYTAYGHIVSGGILVGNGQEVGVGQNIAKVGTTGSSTGCHLHFEVHKPTAIDPVAFMRTQGIQL